MRAMDMMMFEEGTFKLRGKEVSVAGQTLPEIGRAHV